VEEKKRRKKKKKKEKEGVNLPSFFSSIHAFQQIEVSGEGKERKMKKGRKIREDTRPIDPNLLFIYDAV